MPHPSTLELQRQFFSLFLPLCTQKVNRCVKKSILPTTFPMRQVFLIFHHVHFRLEFEFLVTSVFVTQWPVPTTHSPIVGRSRHPVSSILLLISRYTAPARDHVPGQRLSSTRWP